MSGEVKDWLYKWLAKQGKPQPAFNIQPMAGRGRARFKCEIRVTGVPYIGKSRINYSPIKQIQASVIRPPKKMHSQMQHMILLNI